MPITKKQRAILEISGEIGFLIAVGAIFMMRLHDLKLLDEAPEQILEGEEDL